MDRDSLMELITTEDIVNIMSDLGSNYCKEQDNEIIFESICHGKTSHKLWYYKSSKQFQCYSHCGTLSLYDVIMNVLCCNFSESYQYLLKFKGVSGNYSKGKGLINKRGIEDFEFLEKHLIKLNNIEVILPSYDEKVMNIFDDYYPSVWEDEGLNPDEMQHFGIKMYFNQLKAIIPNRDKEGRLIGIRGRSFKAIDIENGKKYMPVTIEGLTYRCPTGMSLYGIYENQENIKKVKKCILFEGEKSVIKYGSYYGRNNNIALATLGTNVSLQQRNMILNMDVNEVVVAYDKQYIFEKIDKQDEYSIKEYNAYMKKVIKIYKLFCNYCTVSLVYCDNDEELNYKDAPIDCGKQTFDSLYRDRVLIESLEELEGELIAV